MITKLIINALSINGFDLCPKNQSTVNNWIVKTLGLFIILATTNNP